MGSNTDIPDVGYNKQATDGRPFFCPHCKTAFSYENIVAEEMAVCVDRKEMIYECKECQGLFRLIN